MLSLMLPASKCLLSLVLPEYANIKVIIHTWCSAHHAAAHEAAALLFFVCASTCAAAAHPAASP